MTTSHPTSHTTSQLASVSRAQLIWRVLLIAGGLGVLGIGGLTLLNDVNPNKYLGILIWFAGAIIVHDGIIGPLIFGAAVIMRKAGRSMPIVVLAIVQGAILVAAIMTAIVVPAAIKKAAGSANPTILPLDYLPNLGAFYVGLAVVTAGAVAVYLVVTARREKRRPADDQD